MFKKFSPVFSVLFFLILCSLMVIYVSHIAPAKEVVLSFSVGDPMCYKNLKVFPVTLKEGPAELGLVTLDEAVEEKYLKISEIDDGQVNSVDLENVSQNWIFLLAGEIISGAKQNRIIGKDTLIPPKSGKVQEVVFCVEHGRWVKETDEFGSYGMNCSMNVRQSAQQNKDQGLVWNEVSKTTTISDEANPTGKFDVVYEDEEVEQKVDEYMKNFSGFVKENKDISGVVVVVGDKIMGADIFGDRELFEKLWPKLLKSYTVDALMTEESDGKKIKKADAEDFLAKFKKAQQEKDDTAIAGTRIEFSSEEVVGGMIFDDYDRLVHFVQFPYVEVEYNQYDNQQINVQMQINAPCNQNE